MSSAFTKGSRWYVYLTSIIPILFGTLMVGAGIYLLISGKIINSAPPNSTKCEVATVIDFSCSSSSDVLPCQVKISYVVQVGKDAPKLFVSATDKHYNVGDNVVLYVSDSDPTQITQINQGSQINPWILVGFGSLMLVLVFGNNWLVSRSSTVANVEGGMAAFNLAKKLY